MKPQDFEFDIGRVVPENFAFDESHTRVVERLIPESELIVAKHKSYRLRRQRPLIQFIGGFKIQCK